MRSTLQQIIEDFFTDQIAKAYYSEAAVQHKLGIEIYKSLNVESELEKLIIRRNRKNYLDLYIEHKSSEDKSTRYGIELKYKTQKVTNPAGSYYTTHAAQNNGRYDLIRDISRLERYRDSGEIHKGFAILITNDPRYWSPAKPGTYAEVFNLHDGRKLPDALTPGGTLTPKWRGRNKPITLRGRYSMKWSKPKTSTNGVPFRYCLIDV